MSNKSFDKNDLQKRRNAARRTAWKLGLLAVVIFAVFFMTGMTGRS